MIILCAGHDKKSVGASYNNFNEYDEAVKWVQLIHDSIVSDYEYPCAIVPDLRTVDPTQTANDVYAGKVRWVNAHDMALLAIEIHFNSDESKRQRGCETLYMPGSEKGHEAAKIVQAELAGLFPPSRGAKEGWHRMDKPGRVDYPGDVDGDENINYWLRATYPVALALEPEFIYNRETIEDKRTAACAALAATLVHIAGWLKGDHNG